MYVQLNGQILYYEKTGIGKPLILLHGNQENHHIFDELTTSLKDSYTIYALDTRGHGLSASPKEFHYQDMGDDLIAFIEALSISSPTILGFSDGAIIALLAALKMPFSISRLYLCGVNLSPQGLKRSTLHQFKKAYKKTSNPLDKLILTEPDISSESLHSLSIPVDIFVGENDMVRKTESKKITTAVSQGTLHILPNEDHSSYIVHSTEIAKYLIS